MNEYDDLLEDVLPEPEGIRSDLARGTAKDQAAPKRPPRKRESSGSGSAAKKSKAAGASRKPVLVAEQAPAEPARRGMARLLERTGRCPMYAPRGTVCKTCGKVHPV